MRVCAECGAPITHRPKSRTCGPVCWFWSKVDSSGGPDACWPWTSHVSARTGYGDVPARYNSGKRISAHRLAWRLYNCCDPDKLCILHRCDNRICANPGHLFPGSHRRNTLDAWSKGRSNACTPGEGHPRARLTDELVSEIRRSNEDSHVLAKRHGVKVQTIRQARQGKTWKHLPMPDEMAPLAGMEATEMLGF